jgi:hypothetical protein
MKKFLIALSLVMAPFVAYAEEPKVKKACVKNEKTGKEVCKDVKVHKKLEGTAVPDPKKK